jgi:hypothetical protein
MPIWELPRRGRFTRSRHRHVDGSIRYDDPRRLRSVRYEDPGAVDGPGDRDERNPNAIDTPAACAIPWVHEGYQAIEVYVEPELDGRAAEICELVNVASGTSKDLENLAEAVFRAVERAGLSAALYDRPADGLSPGALAIAATRG